MQGAPTDFWAKLHADYPETKTWHSLAAHCADVAAVTDALLTCTILRRRLATLIGWDDLSDVHVARLAALAAIHDAGKVNHSFQDQAFRPKAQSRGHVRPIIEVLEAEGSSQELLLLPLGIDAMMGWFSSELDLIHVLLATWGHHGLPVLPQDDFRSRLWENDGRRNPMEGLKELGAYTRRWFPQAFDGAAAPFPSDPALQHAFNGVLTLADWIGSDQRFFAFAGDLDDPMPRARRQAKHAIEALFLDPAATRRHLGEEPVGFRGVLENKKWSPHAIQQACLDLPLHVSGSLTVLESDTGSGKTEAALARFVRLHQAGLVDGMYFAVPTRSAAMQLHRRITRAAARIFPEEQRPSVVQAVPGYIKADDDEATRLPGFEVRWDEDIQHRGWAAEHPKRYLAGPVVVGTVDQVLLSALQVKHAHLRAAALLRHFLVVDEVHASDVYMTALMDLVLDQHLAAGGHVLLMSATLGSGPRARLTTNGRQTPPSPEEAEKEDYPLLTHVDATRADPKKRHAPSSGKNKRVETELRGIAGDPLAVAQLAAERARAGARVLVIRNLVADCRATQHVLEDVAGDETNLLFSIDGTPAPHHSRFAPGDRRRLDANIEATFGKDTPQRGIVAVCTQTVQQSLDIDADILITDLCPMDVLLQRIGRLHRHGRERPDGFETARCIVLTPAERDLSGAIVGDGRGIKGKHGLGTVYDDLRAVEATWQVLEDEELGTWHIPTHNRLLVERATHPQRLSAIVEASGEAWEAHQQHVVGQTFADRQHSAYVGIRRHKPFGDEPFADDLGKVKTRLGEDTYRVELPEPMMGPFGKTVAVLTLSTWQIRGEVPEDMKAEKVEWMDGGLLFSFAGKRFRYNRSGLHEG